MDVLESIRVFKRVAETKSFSAVGAELDLGQPAISKIIKSLETELAVTLFRRSTRGLSLTVEGLKLYNAGGDLIDHFERVLAEVTGQKLMLSGELRISASLAFARVILIPLLRNFEKLHPDLRLNFLLSDGFIDLIENNIDVAIRIGDLPDSNLKAIKIGSSSRCLYAAKTYLKEYGRPKNVEGLREHKLLFYTRLHDGPTWSLREKNGASKKISFDPFIKTDGSDLMREAVLAGLGIAMMPTWLMIDYERQKIVERLFEEAVPRPSSINSICVAGRELTSKQRAFIDFLSHQFANEPSMSIRR